MQTSAPIGVSGRPKVLILSSVWPEPTSSAAGVRTENLLFGFKDAGWEVWMGSPGKLNEHSQSLERRGIRTQACPMNDPAFDAFVTQLAPSVVIFDRFVVEEQFGWRVREFARDALRVLDLQDLHSLRWGRETLLKRELESEANRDQARAEAPAWTDPAATALHALRDPLNEDALREVAAILRSDVSWTLSGKELSLLVEVAGIDPALLRLHRIWYPPRPATSRPWGARAGIVWIGNFRHGPNMDGLRWFRSEIWPTIRARHPLAEVHVYGSYPPKEAMEWNQPTLGFRVHGAAKDARETLGQYRVNLASLRYGAGIKGKILDGWWAGTPVVTTAIGTEGMLPAGATFPGEVADHPADFADRVVALLEDELRWKKVQAAGALALDTNYGMAAEQGQWLTQLILDLDQRESRRAHNLLGRVLWQQSHRSTVYFSKWIEAKNRSCPA